MEKSSRNIKLITFLIVVFPQSFAVNFVQNNFSVGKNRMSFNGSSAFPLSFAYNPLLTEKHDSFFRNTTSDFNFGWENVTRERCTFDSMKILSSLSNLDALAVLDAQAKVPSGVFRGNFLWMGDYEECITNSVLNTNSTFSTHYCVASWDVKLPNTAFLSYIPLKTGLCFPSSCSSTAIKANISSFVNLLDNVFLKKNGLFINLTDVTCRDPHEPFDVPAICYMSILSIIFCAVLLGSSYSIYLYVRPSKKLQLSRRHKFVNYASGETDVNVVDAILFIGDDKLVVCQPQDSTACKKRSLTAVLKCFCIFTNSAKILTSDVSKDHLLCIHGVRVLTMLWIILGHTYIHCLPVVDNLIDVAENIDGFAFQTVLRGSFAVDTFFFLSGFLLSFLLVQESEKQNGKIILPQMFIHRYWRLTPLYALVIGYIASVFKYTGSGIFWDKVPDYESCTKNWWWNLLYINNFQSIRTMCADYTWYLANDMQFYIVCSLLIYITFRWSKWAWNILIALLMSNWAVTWIISEHNLIEPDFYNISRAKDFVQYEAEAYRSFDLIYSKPWCRIAPYLIGIFTGHMFYKTKGEKGFLNASQKALLWVFAMMLMLSVVFGLYNVKSHDQLLFNFYNSYSRSAFSLGVALVVYNCLTGHAHLVNKFLSWKAWIPLSRLTYVVYLIHPIIITYYFQSLDAPFHFSHQEVVMHWLAFVVMSYGIGFLVSVTVESPLLALEKVFLPSYHGGR